MTLQLTNQEVMSRAFDTIRAEASLKEAYQALKKNLEGPPHAPGLVVVEQKNTYAGVLTMDDFMTELAKLHRSACDKPGRPQWLEAFFGHCGILGTRKVAEIMSGKRLSVPMSGRFDQSCELILNKKLPLLAVVDENARPAGIITRRKVLEALAPRLFQ
jgi:predicted transcriptional regulator|uniref:CBS domain-containing protein n=1 Tax=Desulfobacca acetoxidans TaxID=60893 RepID=A0A7V6A138_9BACT